MLLHENKKALEEAVRATANFLSLPVEYVEKDYWVTYALKSLAESNLTKDIVFKGGTSLSKAYQMISRFSEDVDIAVLTEGLSHNQAGRKVRKVCKVISKLEAIFQEIESPDTSKNSHFRKMRFQYPRMDESIPVKGQITDSLLLEVNAFADPEPYKKMQISSYVADFFNQSGQQAAVAEFKLNPFEMNVLCTSRTVCEKIMGLVKASYGESYITNINAKIRHLYDVYYLMQDEFTRDFVNSDQFKEMAEKVITCDRATFTSVPWFDQPLTVACVFENLEAIWPQLASTYNGDFKGMVVGETLPAPEELFAVTRDIHKQLNQTNWTSN